MEPNKCIFNYEDMCQCTQTICEPDEDCFMDGEDEED